MAVQKKMIFAVLSYRRSGVSSSSYGYYGSGRIGVTENRNCQSAELYR